MTDTVIRMLCEKNLQEITRIHLAAFPKSALSLLGTSVVARYYKWQLHSQHDAVALGIFQGQSLAGFCFTGVFHRALSGFLHKNRMFLSWRVLIHPRLIANPLFRDRLNLAWAALIRSPVPHAPQPVIPGKSFGVLVIAVDPQVQHEGFGKKLMLETEKVARKKDFLHLHLTVAPENFQAIAFYEYLGWQKSLVADGIWHGLMIKVL